ncbi:DUF4956 domain-containing protein [Ancylomarina sp. 16SWW S1-10-2]|uniref:DUF4956 domain-containing protein n=1 Tax=Ancylomarina sp. 16SWW S1-10-2 TaxID=2499681 RepID=UPI0012ADF3BB|nr:DUF4956 domain-containing protein [Ancylomarina sp. 16SWW S1-10-2]MRT93529.1 DUF4956 domain-containing protein [Ancylomarina sp. 16SWW S1-10-2]
MLDLLQISDTITNTAPALTGWEEQFRFLGIKLINVGDFTELIVRFAFNTFLLFLVTHCMYAKNSSRKDFYFSYLAIGVIVFLLCFLLNSVKLELGFALGLFAIFGIIRYRTDAIPIKEMTYLFIIIGISVMNALSNKKVSYSELILTNTLIVAGLWFLEKKLMLKQEKSIKLIYEKIENIHKNKHEEMLRDFQERTGINICRYEIEKIDFLRDVAEITLYYNVNGQPTDKHLN